MNLLSWDEMQVRKQGMRGHGMEGSYSVGLGRRSLRNELSGTAHSTKGKRSVDISLQTKECVPKGQHHPEWQGVTAVTGYLQVMRLFLLHSHPLPTPVEGKRVTATVV